MAFAASSSTAQKFDLPELAQLISSVDNYYKELTSSQKKENDETGKMRWLNYIPSPSYSPFTGGLGATLNLTAPLQELSARRIGRLKNASIERMNKLQSEDLKNQIKYQYQIIEMEIDEYYKHKIIDSLREVSYKLSEKSYTKNQMAPTEFLQIQQGYELYKLTRITAENGIKKMIMQICINAKKDATGNSIF